MGLLLGPGVGRPGLRPRVAFTQLLLASVPSNTARLPHQGEGCRSGPLCPGCSLAQLQTQGKARAVTCNRCEPLGVPACGSLLQVSVDPVDPVLTASLRCRGLGPQPRGVSLLEGKRGNCSRLRELGVLGQIPGPVTAAGPSSLSPPLSPPLG